MCAWDGLTYIFSHQQEILCFDFQNGVRAFCAGQYSIGPGQKVPCFVYITLEGYITIYYNVKMRSLSLHTATSLLREDLREFDVLKENSAFYGIEWDTREQVSLIHSCLYHFPQEELEEYRKKLQEKLQQKSMA
jgi:hypothetical protein